MRLILAAATLAALTGPALAQTTIIEREAPPRAVVIEREPVVVERRAVPVEREGGCETKTVTRTEEDGSSTTVRRERCD
ncbi:hypothetical protein [Methylobacterium soli]|uniref:Secreted protein n=1 Tax=Methylobacterium soli TaxID=553447 RepID=A0A6L3STD7_9HYPH|nr:hypothetical protein [Methylobacterium soli]KAB1076855.1 hypothetical protein F6X53_21570 [Methylobacterium soli]GJE46040.1 hypothetical protein AEGHOMDF_5240 [Methylobacterium soli]